MGLLCTGGRGICCFSTKKGKRKAQILKDLRFFYQELRLQPVLTIECEDD